MPVTCPVTLDTVRLRREVQAVYARLTREPDGAFHFHRGPAYAARVLGYDEAELAALPEEVTARFAGIGNPHAAGPLPRGATVLDVGCGAGTDLLLAARHVGPSGRAIGVDMTDDMLARARRGADVLRLGNVDLRLGDATAIPVETGSVDVVLSNGVLNLVPEKDRAIAEVRRVLRPGGRVQVADVALGTDLSESARADIDLWTG